MQPDWNRWAAAWLALLSLTHFGVAARAEDAAAAPPPVELDRLLRLPDSMDLPAEIDRRGGATRSEWQARFEAAHADVASADSALQEARAELEELAGDSSAWKVSAPGMKPGSGDDAPMDYQLSQKLKRRREELDRAKRKLRELEVEANLAGVPDQWTRAE